SLPALRREPLPLGRRRAHARPPALRAADRRRRRGGDRALGADRPCAAQQRARADPRADRARRDRAGARARVARRAGLARRGIPIKILEAQTRPEPNTPLSRRRFCARVRRAYWLAQMMRWMNDT